MAYSIIDQGLLLLSAFTIALIVWKSIELYLPGIIKKARAENAAQTPGELDVLLEKLERGMTLLATIAALAPFIGLTATIVHIRSALTLIGGSVPDTAVVAGPIAKALGSTLLGLAAAIPAAAAHNIFSRRLQLIENRTRRRFTAQVSVSESLSNLTEPNTL